MLFLSIQGYHLDGATKPKLRTFRQLLTNLSHQELPMKKEKDLSKSIFARCFHFGLDWLAWRFLSDPDLIGGCLTKVAIQGSITITPPCTSCLNTQSV